MSERIGRDEGRVGRPTKERKKIAPGGPSRSDGGIGWFWKVLLLVLLLGFGGLGLSFGARNRAPLLCCKVVLMSWKPRLFPQDESFNQSGVVLSVKLKNQEETLDKHWSGN